MKFLIFAIAITHSFFQTPDIPRLESPRDSEVIFPKIASTTVTDRSVEVPDAGFKKRLHDPNSTNLFRETEKPKGCQKRVQGFPVVVVPRIPDGIQVPDAGYQKRVQHSPNR